MIPAALPDATRRREAWRSLLLFLLLVICFGYTFPRWADPNQNSRLDMVFAVVDDGSFQIDRYVANTVDFARVGDHYYSDKAPGVAFLGVPIYAAIRPVLEQPVVHALEARLASNAAFRSTLRPEGTGLLEEKIRFAIVQVLLTILLAALPSALLGVGIYRWLVEATPNARLRLTVVVSYGLLSPAFAYAGALYGHQLAAALLFGAFLLANGGKPRMRPVRLMGIGALLVAAVLTEYPAAIVAGVVGAYTSVHLVRQRQVPAVGWVMVGGLPFIAGWMAYNTAVFGAPLAVGYAFSTLWTAQHQTGFMSLTLPSWEAAWGITMSGFRGLFVLSPILLIAALGYLPWWRSGQLRFEWALAVFASLGMLSFNASSAMWWGGFAIGPRYFLPGLPFLALGLAFALREWSHRSWVRGLLIAAAAWSLIATWGLTLAGQAFPSDTIRSPLLEYAWPNWLSGNIARNLGTMMGLPGASSLLPLLLIGVLLIGVGWGRPDAAFRRSSRPVGTIAPSQGGPSPHEEAPAALSGDRRPRGGGEA